MSNPSSDEKRLAAIKEYYCQESAAWSRAQLGIVKDIQCVLRLLDAAQARIKWHENRAEEREVAIAGLKTRLLQAERERDGLVERAAEAYQMLSSATPKDNK